MGAPATEEQSRRRATEIEHWDLVQFCSTFGNEKYGTEQVTDLREAIAENWSVTLFPEGTTSDGRGLLPFKGSLFATLAPPPLADAYPAGFARFPQGWPECRTA